MASGHVFLVDLGCLRDAGTCVGFPDVFVLRIELRGDHRVLGTADAVHDGLRLVYVEKRLSFFFLFFGKFLNLCLVFPVGAEEDVSYAVFEARRGVVLVIDGERGGEAQVVVEGPQEFHEDGMEGSGGDMSCFFTTEGNDSGFHLAGGLVGEGEGEDVFRGCALGEKEGDAAGEHPGLAGSGAGHYKRRAVGVEHRGFLLVVESFEDVFYGVVFQFG